MSRNLILILGVLLIWFLVIRNTKSSSTATANTPEVNNTSATLKTSKSGAMTAEYVPTQTYTL